MLIEKRFWEPIERGEVTVTFRRWKRSQVLAGRTYRTAAGRLAVDTVDEVAPERISDADARRAGYADATTLVGDLRGEEGQPVFRIAFRHLPEPDPRTELANDDALDPEAIAAITARLDRLDRSSSHGPWTASYLEAIESNPERRAPDLAETFGRETQPFKLDVRKLKNMGLTVSCPVGYRLSRRGEAYLAAQRQREA
ncbi:MAG: hypothetical protein ACFCVC_17025 [Acidimicrobiia bacterium]